ncbi:hypothetical protein [Flavobacterium panacagri]|uniref:hypothetical protein n=1 Tax=Flavobacterium panacagri TaxID=3034146 RepID=UPI0025A57168|nr:hypothetical protein [Flavobacterium panacagri]
MDISNTIERVKFALSQMEKAMPEVKKQIALYERNIALGKTNTKPQPQSRMHKTPYNNKL